MIGNQKDMEEAQHIIDERVRVENFDTISDDNDEPSPPGSPKKQHSPGKRVEAGGPMMKLPVKKVNADLAFQSKFGAKANASKFNLTQEAMKGSEFDEMCYRATKRVEEN